MLSVFLAFSLWILFFSEFVSVRFLFECCFPACLSVRVLRTHIFISSHDRSSTLCSAYTHAHRSTTCCLVERIVPFHLPPPPGVTEHECAGFVQAVQKAGPMEMEDLRRMEADDAEQEGGWTRHGVATMECHGSIEHRPCNEERPWTTVPSTMSGGLIGYSSHRERPSARLQARQIRECMMNDFSRNGRFHCVVQRSLEEKPEVYSCGFCVGW